MYCLAATDQALLVSRTGISYRCSTSLIHKTLEVEHHFVLNSTASFLGSQITSYFSFTKSLRHLFFKGGGGQIYDPPWVADSSYAIACISNISEVRNKISANSNVNLL